MPDVDIGVVTHYFDKIKVAVIKLKAGDLKIGDTLKMITVDGKEFSQKVDSMQIEHAEIEIAKKGDEFGVKVGKEPKIKSAVVKTS